MEDDLIPSSFYRSVDLVENALNDPAFFVPCGTLTGQGFQQHPHGAAIRVGNHVPLEGIDHILGAQCPAFMELHALADGERVSPPVLRDAAVFQARYLRGQNGLKLVRVGAVEKDECFVYIPQSLGGRHIVSRTRIKGPEVTVVSKYERIGVFRLPMNYDRKKEE